MKRACRRSPLKRRRRTRLVRSHILHLLSSNDAPRPATAETILHPHHLRLHQHPGLVQLGHLSLEDFNPTSLIGQVGTLPSQPLLQLVVVPVPGSVPFDKVVHQPGVPALDLQEPRLSLPGLAFQSVDLRSFVSLIKKGRTNERTRSRSITSIDHKRPPIAAE